MPVPERAAGQKCSESQLPVSSLCLLDQFSRWHGVRDVARGCLLASRLRLLARLSCLVSPSVPATARSTRPLSARSVPFSISISILQRPISSLVLFGRSLRLWSQQRPILPCRLLGRFDFRSLTAARPSGHPSTATAVFSPGFASEVYINHALAGSPFPSQRRCFHVSPWQTPRFTERPKHSRS